jgi:creatinine amidohydrolase
MSVHGRPWRLEELTPAAARARLQEHPVLLLPVGGTAAQASHLPLGADTLIVEHLADDVSAARGIVCAPALKYGVHPGAAAHDGGVALRRKTLHRVVNELIDCWEDGAGIHRFVILTALANDAHLEALTTVRTERSALLAVDVLGFEFGERLAARDAAERGKELATALLLHIAPDTVADSAATPLSRDRGRDLYHFILERILHLVDAAPLEVK